MSRTLFGAFDRSIVPQNGAFLSDVAVYQEPLPDFVTSLVSHTNIYPLP